MSLTKEDLLAIHGIVHEVVRDVIHEVVNDVVSNVVKNIIRTEVTPKFIAIDQKFVDIDGRFVGIDKRFVSIDQRFVEMKEYMDLRFTSLDRAAENIATEIVSIIGDIFDEHDRRIQRLEKCSRAS